VIEVRQVCETSDFPAKLVPPEWSARERALGEELQDRAAGR